MLHASTSIVFKFLGGSGPPSGPVVAVVFPSTSRRRVLAPYLEKISFRGVRD
jgi:hypothetical protein